MPRGKTQRQQVLDLLKGARHLNRGVTTAEFLRHHLPRAQARIHELRRDGWPITTSKVRQGSYVYTLIGPQRIDATNPGTTERRRWTIREGKLGGIIIDGPRPNPGEVVQVVES